MGNSVAPVEPVCRFVTNVQVINNTRESLRMIAGGIDPTYSLSMCVNVCATLSGHSPVYRRWYDSVELAPRGVHFFAETSSLCVLDDASGPSPRLLWEMLPITSTDALRRYTNKVLSEIGRTDIEVGRLSIVDDENAYFGMQKRTVILEFVNV